MLKVGIHTAHAVRNQLTKVTKKFQKRWNYDRADKWKFGKPNLHILHILFYILYIIFLAVNAHKCEPDVYITAWCMAVAAQKYYVIVGNE